MTGLAAPAHLSLTVTPLALPLVGHYGPSRMQTTRCLSPGGELPGTAWTKLRPIISPSTSTMLYMEETSSLDPARRPGYGRTEGNVRDWHLGMPGTLHAV